MMLKFVVSPDVEQRLKEKAQRRGVSVEKYLGELAERDARELAPIEADTGGADKRDVAARLQAVREFTRAAQEMSGGAAPHGGTWNREEIYEGDADRILGIRSGDGSGTQEAAA